jgi:hypothetical protein
VVISPHTKPRAHGLAAAGQTAVVGQRLRKAHADARAAAGGEADQKSFPTAVRSERGGKQRRQRRDRAVHQSGQPRLNDLQQEEPFLLRLVVFTELGDGDAFSGMRVIAFLLRKIAEQLPDARVGCATSGNFVKSFRFQFHAFGGFLDDFQAERTHEPDGAAVHKSAHVLPADKRHVVTETAFVKFEQAVAVAILFAAHHAEFIGLFGIIFLQAGGEIFIDARVLLLKRDSQREDFLFGKARRFS